MKKNIKSNVLWFFLFFLLLLLIGYCIFQYQQNYQKSLKNYEKLVEYYKYNEEEYKEYVSILGELKKPEKADAVSAFIDISRNSIIMVLTYIGPIIILIASCSSLNKKLRSGILKDISLRTDYHKYIKKEIFKVYLKAMIIPISYFLLFIVCLIFTKSMDINYTLDNHISNSFNSKYLTCMPFYFIYFFVNLTIFSLFIANIGAIIIRKNSNFWVSCILGFLIFIFLEIGLEAILEPIIIHLISRLNGNFVILDNFNILPQAYFYIENHLYINNCLLLFLFIISLWLVYKTYKNKEGVMIDCEK